MNKLFLLAFVAILTSCGSQRNFSKQKFTDLKPLSVVTTSDCEGLTSNAVAKTTSDYKYEEQSELDLMKEDQLDFSLESEPIEKAHLEISDTDIIENEIPTDSTETTVAESDAPKSNVSNDPYARKARKLFFLALGCLAGLIGGILLLFTSLYAAGAGLMVLSFILGYSFLIGSRINGKDAKRRLKRGGGFWGKGDQAIQGLVVAALVGFGIGALPLALMALVGAFGWYA